MRQSEVVVGFLDVMLMADALPHSFFPALSPFFFLAEMATLVILCAISKPLLLSFVLNT